MKILCKMIYISIQDVHILYGLCHISLLKTSYYYVIAANLHVYPAEHVIYGDYVYKEWDKEMIKNLLGFFTPENMRIDVVSKCFKKSEGKFLERSILLDVSIARLELF